MSSTPSKTSRASSATPGSHTKRSSSSTSERSSKPSNHNSHDSAKKDKSHKSSKSKSTHKSQEEMDVDELADHLVADLDSSISSMDVSDDESVAQEGNAKKRKRPETDHEEDQEMEQAEVIMMKRVPVKKAVVDVSEIQDDDVQLWLFKIPETMDAEMLNGTSMKIGSTVNIGGVDYTISEGATLESDSLVNVWPDTESGKIALGKPFSKMVHVSEAPKATGTDASQIVANLAAFLKFGTTRSPLALLNYDDTATPELKVRYVPGGATLPVSSSSSFKPSSSFSPGPISSPTTQSSDHSKHKKHKEGKHKHKEGKHKHKE